MALDPTLHTMSWAAACSACMWLCMRLPACPGVQTTMTGCENPRPLAKRSHNTYEQYCSPEPLSRSVSTPHMGTRCAARMYAHGHQVRCKHVRTWAPGALHACTHIGTRCAQCLYAHGHQVHCTHVCTWAPGALHACTHMGTRCAARMYAGWLMQGAWCGVFGSGCRVQGSACLYVGYVGT